MWRTFPATCDWSWHEMQPVGETRTYLGIDVYEGAYTYRGMHVVPAGAEACSRSSCPRFRARVELGAAQLGGQPPAARARPARARARRGRLRLLGLLALEQPAGGYREYGVDPLGLNPTATSPTQERTNSTSASATAGRRQPEPDLRRRCRHPARVVPRDDARAQQAYANLVGIQDELKAYGNGGFFDAVAVRSGTIARRYLSLDQAMVMGAIGNVMARNVFRRAFSTRDVEQALRPVIGMEEFGAGIA